MKQSTKDVICTVGGLIGTSSVGYTVSYCTSLAAVLHLCYPNKLVAAVGSLTVEIAGQALAIYTGYKAYDITSSLIAEMIGNDKWDESIFCKEK